MEPALDTERFEVVRPLGAGAMGVVYEARDRKHRARVAVKTLRSLDPDRLYWLKHEFRALADIVHPNLVALFELIATDDRCFITMELVDGGVDLLAHVRPAIAGGVVRPRRATTDTATVTLGTGGAAAAARIVPRLALAATCDVDRLRAAAGQLVAGVDHLHRAAKLHRDLKPSNVLVDRDGRVVVCDFGLVVDVVDGTARTGESHAVGTALYMSPEQAANLPLTPASDWYSVGVMLYEALVGSPPFTGRPTEVLARKQIEVPRRPSDLVDGVPPDLDQLCVDLLRRRAADRPSSDEIRDRLGARRASVVSIPRAPALVGRDDERAALAAALAATANGRPVIVTVGGPSGIGKTALVRDFIDDVIARDAAVVLAGACYEHASVPYKAFDSLIDALSAYLVSLPSERVAALVPADAGALARVFPVLARAGAIAALAPTVPVIDAPELRRRVFRALRELIGRLALGRPLVLWVDDLHWADADSSALFAELIRGPHAPPILFVGGHRTDLDADCGFVRAAITAAPGRAAAAVDLRAIIVDALAPAAATALAAALLPPGDGRDPAAIARESGGSPLVVDELVRFSGAASTSLAAMVQARFEQLSPTTRAVLDVVAVAGRPLPRAVVGAAVDPPGDAHRALVELRAERLVCAGGDPDADELVVRHDTVRAAVLAALTAPALRERHERIALAMEITRHDDPEALAEHWSAAARPQLAGRYATAAADRAAAALAFDRAAGLYRQALTQRDLDPAAIHALEVRLADALADGGRGAEAGEVYLRAAEGAAPADALELRRRAFDQLLRGGSVERGLAVIGDILAPVGLELARTPARAAASAAVRRVRLRLRGIRFRERTAAELPPAVLAKIDTCWSVAASYGMADNIRGSDLQIQHLLLALAAGEPHRVCRGLALETVYVALAGGPVTARHRELAATTAALAARLADPYLLGFDAMTSGLAALLRGQWRRGLADVDRASGLLADCRGAAAERGTAGAYGLSALTYLGDYLELDTRASALFADAERRGDLYLSNVVRSWRANLRWLVDDDPAAARAAIDEAIRTWPRAGFLHHHYYEVLSGGMVDLYAGRPEQALARIEATWPAMTRAQIMRIQSSRIEMWCLRARCVLALARPDADADAARVLADARRIEREAMPWATPLALLVRAAAVARRDPPGAVAILAAAVAGFAAADMAAHAAVARRRRGELIGGDDGRAAIAGADAELVARGVRNPDRLCAMIAPGFPLPR